MWHAWEAVIRMNPREIGWESVDWIQLAQDRDQWLTLVNTVMNIPARAPRVSLVSSKQILDDVFVHSMQQKSSGRNKSQTGGDVGVQLATYFEWFVIPYICPYVASL
jgi:hypothetical protein